MKKLIPIVIIIFILIISLLCYNFFVTDNNETELIEISSKAELQKIYDGSIDDTNILSKLLTLPFSIIYENSRNSGILTNASNAYDAYSSGGIVPNEMTGTSSSASSASDSSVSSTQSSKDYSTTNIQVENVDEADIVKTDGDYIYSLSENKVIITDVRDEAQIRIVAEIEPRGSNRVPVDLILYNNKLIVISEKANSSSSYYAKNSKTITSVYDISDKEKPKEVKDYELEQPYYTSRCIDGKLYIISSGRLKEENDEVVTYYYEDGKQIDPGYNNIKRIRDLDTSSQTILSMLDLNNLDESVKVNSYLMDVENAYVSENNIYLLDEKYESLYSSPSISSIFGLRGILGAFTDYDDEHDSGRYTYIYKFNLLDDGSIQFDKKAKEKGTTINQFSIDEYEGNLRVALYNNDGSNVVIFNDEMKKIGETEKFAEGERMYSSRFLGDRAYLVTYKTIDPLFVIDLSNPEDPEVLGELKIPGYSTYLHPYDENHLIGFGMQTEEKVNRNSSGRVISTTATITGMKMALFDVTDINNPIQISDTVIGDKRTTSAILTNHKALLFSKEKQLLAIPVNNYTEDFEIDNSSNTYSSLVNSYTRYNKEYVSEGYFVYNINLTDGFTLKGTITHEKTKGRYSYYNTSRLLRGLYIDDNLYTVSEDYVKVNRLDDLQEVSQVKIKEDE